MADIKVELEKIIKHVSYKFQDIKPVLPIIMAFVQQKIDENFAKQGRWNGSTSGINLLSGGSKRWTPLAPSTLERYKNSKVKRPMATILNRSGLMRKQIGYKINGNQLVITSGAPYAAIHQFGGTIDHPGGTPYIVVKDKIYHISKLRAAKLKGKNKPVFYTKPHKITIPPRPYIVLSKEDMNEIIEKIKGLVLK